MRYLARRGTADWMVWDRDERRPASKSGRSLVRLDQAEAVRVAARLNGIGSAQPDDLRLEMTSAEILYTIKLRPTATYPILPRGVDLMISLFRDGWHAVCYTPDPVRDAAFTAHVRSIADDLVKKVKLRV